VSRKPVRGFHQSDILNQQPDHPLAFAIGRVRVRPQPRKIRGQPEDLGALGGIQVPAGRGRPTASSSARPGMPWQIGSPPAMPARWQT
jgi:hypothetical protein